MYYLSTLYRTVKVIQLTVILAGCFMDLVLACSFAGVRRVCGSGVPRPGMELRVDELFLHSSANEHLAPILIPCVKMRSAHIMTRINQASAKE